MIPEGEQGLIALVGTDFVAGELVLFDPGTGELSEGVAITSGDPIVREVAGEIALIDRSEGDSLRIYSPTDWTRPRLEVLVPGGANLHDVAAWGDGWVGASYEGLELLRWRPSGQGREPVDLSAFRDSDGSVEAESLVVAGDRLLVALQRFDRASGWTRSDGSLVLVNSAGQVVAESAAGPSPRLEPSSSPGFSWVATGLFFEEDGSVARVRWEDLQQDPPVLRESEVGGDFGALAEVGGYLVISSTDLDSSHSRLWCLSLGSGVLRPGPVLSDGWFVAIQAWRDQALVAVRSGWTVPGAHSHLWRLDPATCEGEETIPLRSEPYDLALLP